MVICSIAFNEEKLTMGEIITYPTRKTVDKLARIGLSISKYDKKHVFFASYGNLQNTVLKFKLGKYFIEIGLG